MATKKQRTPELVIALDGDDWLIDLDPDNAGRDRRWYENPTPGARRARVPGIIQEVFPEGHGVAWYWRDFTPPRHPHRRGRYLLRFHAVDYLADIWVNGAYLGQYEGGEMPFVLDATDAVRPETANRLAVRVVNPTDVPIDGLVLGETPHRNKSVALKSGNMYNSGGIVEPVELLLAPPVRIEDVFVKPDWKTGNICVYVNVQNSLNESDVNIEVLAGPAFSTGASASGELSRRVTTGDTLVQANLQINNHRLWDIDDPYLYRLTVRLECSSARCRDERQVRFGFRDFRVEKGYFRLNGRRIFLKSSHTGNHCPVGQVLPPAGAPDLLRKDLLYAKAAGFNAVRFIAGVAHPYQLDLCDEIGLMVYEENLAGWLLGDSPKMKERYDRSLRDMIVRDRNHPSLVIWGLLNETKDDPVFRHAVGRLEFVRSLDDTRLVLLNSGRWDGQLGIGSVCNPGGLEWEHEWGEEESGRAPVPGPQWRPLGGYVPGMGDAHVYPRVPQSPEVDEAIRALGRDSKPVFLSEYGIGSINNAIRELRTYRQHNINPALDDVRFFQSNVDQFLADWNRLGMDGVYPFPEDMLRASQRLHARQRLLGFDLIRSNPKICGFNLTGLLDHGFSGEGLWTFWREYKPGIMDALQDGWAPLRWCLFAAPLHGYADRPVRLEAVLANEEVLAPGSYPVVLRVAGPEGIAWEHHATVVVPDVAPGEDGPLALPVFAGDVALSGPAGSYVFAADMDGAAPAGGRLEFRFSDPTALPPVDARVACWGIEERVKSWLEARGIACRPFDRTCDDRVILVGVPSQGASMAAAWSTLLEHMQHGATAVFLSPEAFKEGDDAVARLPLEPKGNCVSFNDWLYHKECVAKKHRAFDGLQTGGILDWDYYGPVISRIFFKGQPTPDETVAAAFALCHQSPPGGYTAGVMVGLYRYGSGRFILNTLHVLENVGVHPAADRLLLNLIRWASEPPTAGS